MEVSGLPTFSPDLACSPLTQQWGPIFVTVSEITGIKIFGRNEILYYRQFEPALDS
jgi:hypothetical protein